MGFTSSIYSWASSKMSERELKEAAYNAGYKIKRIYKEKRPSTKKSDSAEIDAIKAEIKRHEDRLRKEKRILKEQRRAEYLLKRLDAVKDVTAEEEEAKKAERKRQRKIRKVRNGYMVMIVELRVKYQNNPDCLDFPKLYAERYVPFALERGIEMKSFDDFVNDVKFLGSPAEINV